MAGDLHRSVNSIYQRPRRLQEEAEGAEEGSNRRRGRTASRRRGRLLPCHVRRSWRRTASHRRGPREDESPMEELEEEVAPVDESDEELVR